MQFGKLMVLNRTCVNGLIWRKKTPLRALIGSRDTLDPSFKPKRLTGPQTKKKPSTAEGPVSSCSSCCFILNDFCQSVSDENHVPCVTWVIVEVICAQSLCQVSLAYFFIYAKMSNIAIYMSPSIYTVWGAGTDFYWIMKTGWY